MGLRSSAGTALTIGLVGLVAIMLFGQVLGQPIGLGFVETGSMSPTLEPGDGFVAVPPALAGDIGEGDVVTFNAEEVGGGGLTTHRVVRETNRGYITQGDANPFTDQDGGEPVVRDSDIVAVALQFNGDLVVIPNLGTAVTGLQELFRDALSMISTIPGLGALAQGGFGSVMIGFGLSILGLSFAADFLTGRKRSGRSRSRKREGMWSAGLILLVIILLVTVPATLSMVIPSGPNEIQIISSSSPTEDPTIIKKGGSQEVTYNATNSGFVPRVVIVEPGTEGVEISNQVLPLAAGGQSSSQVTISVPNETGVYIRSLSIHHYVQVLPTSLIIFLHAIHPWVAVLTINLFLATVVTIIYAITIGFNPVRLRSTSRNISLTDKLKRYLP